MDIKDRVALVTGGASGIGRATAAALKQRGARVVIADIDQSGGEKTAAELEVEFQFLDVRDTVAWEELVNRLVEAHGGLDIAHLNAGLLTPRAGGVGSLTDPFDLLEMKDDDYRRVTAINIDGVVLGARAVARAMSARGAGAIVATASVAGIIPFSGDPMYTMTKHAIVGFVRATAPGLAGHKITLNMVCPGIVETNIAAADNFEAMRGMGMPVMQPSQIADAVVQAIESGETGEALVCLPGQPPIKQVFPTLDIMGGAKP